jgi:hypothetical protein
MATMLARYAGWAGAALGAGGAGSEPGAAGSAAGDAAGGAAAGAGGGADGTSDEYSEGSADGAAAAGAAFFADDAQIAGWAKEAVNAMAAAGLINGVGGGNFAPLKTATRAEAATLLARFDQSV